MNLGYHSNSNIITIPGIGKVAGIVLTHLFIKYSDANKKQIVSLTGLDPVIKDSGTSVKSDLMKKMGA
ncbi:MAG: IS110 family transposase [Sulfurimonas sp.]|nr:IS110 family transposase [Sulfurimonas sp.]